jgi:hypothetical protein
LPNDEDLNDFDVAAMLYNYAVAYLLCYWQQQQSQYETSSTTVEESTISLDYYLQSAKKLLVFAHDIVLQDMILVASASDQEEKETSRTRMLSSTSMLQLANLVLSGLDMVCQLLEPPQDDDREEEDTYNSSLRDITAQTQSILAHYLEARFAYESLFHCDAAGAA